MRNKLPLKEKLKLMNPIRAANVLKANAGVALIRKHPYLASLNEAAKYTPKSFLTAPNIRCKPSFAVGWSPKTSSIQMVGPVMTVWFI